MTPDIKPELGNVSRREAFTGVTLGTGATILNALRSLGTKVEATGGPWIKGFAKGTGVAGAGGAGLELLQPPTIVEAQEVAARVPWENGKLVQISRSLLREPDGSFRSIFHHIDIRTLGPDVDAIVGVDFLGNLKTGALVINEPPDPVETRVVFIKRTDLDYVQLNDALGGDIFYIFRVSEHGGDPVLDAMARQHAENSAHTHQKVVYLGDLGLFQTQWPNEADFLRTIIRAQRPSRLGIPESKFVKPRVF